MKSKILVLLLLSAFFVNAQNITWTDISSSYTLPTGIKIYSGIDASIPLLIKYIDIDRSYKNLDLRPVVNASSFKNTRDWVSANNGVVGMNGGFFGTGASFSAVVNSNGVESKNIAAVTRSNGSYPVIRGFFGQEADGSMKVNWIYHFGNTITDIYKYTAPLPNTTTTIATAPLQGDGVSYANLISGLGAGPIIVKNNQIIDSYEQEVFFGSGVSNTGLDPRSAIGITANNHLILLVADGRQPGVSIGASIPQIANIMKNLGCTEALNCDGGGSTQLATANNFINTPSETYRSVASAWVIIDKSSTIEIPTPLTPTKDQSNTTSPVNFSWSMDYTSGSNYRLQVSKSLNGWNATDGFTTSTNTTTDVVVNELAATENFSWTNAVPGTTYYWTVNASKSSLGTSNYSAVQSFTVAVPNAISVDWMRAATTNNIPSWFSATGNSERGIAYADNKVYVASRTGGTFVKVLNALSGVDLADLNTTIITGGTNSINDIETSEDNAILACNLTINSSANFKIYKWDNDTSVPTVFIDYVNTTSYRLGDSFTVIGNISTNAAIYVPAGNSSSTVLRWIITNGILGSPTVITLSGFTFGSVPAVAPIDASATSDFFVNANAKNATLFSASGTNKGAIASAILPIGSHSTKAFSVDGKNYLITFLNSQTAGDVNGNCAKIIDITNGIATATTVALSTRLGNNANANTTGDVAVRIFQNPVSLVAYTLATNNGLSGKKIFGSVIDPNLSTGEFESHTSHEATKIFPNPAQDYFNVVIDIAIAKNATLQVFTSNGVLVKEVKIEKNIQPVSISNLIKGIYLIKVQNGKTITTNKLIKI